MSVTAPNIAEVAPGVARICGSDPLGVIAAWIFGSVARGTARSDSDVDVAVFLGRSPESTLTGIGMDLQARLEQELGRAVQVVIADHAPPDLIVRTFRDGVLVLDRDPVARLRFEVRRRSEWYDLEPLRNACRLRRGAMP